MNYEELTKEQLISIHKDTLLYLGEVSKEYEDLEKEIERLHSIIKEVREYFKNHTLKYDDLMLIKPSDVFEILDKENSNGSN